MNIQECAFYFNILILHNILNLGEQGGGLITMRSWSNILWWRLRLASALLQCLILFIVWEGAVQLKGVWSPGTVGVTSFDDGCAWLQTSATLQTFPHFCKVRDSHFQMYWKKNTFWVVYKINIVCSNMWQLMIKLLYSVMYSVFP